MITIDPSAPPRPRILSCMELSTAHLSPATRELMDREAALCRLGVPIYRKEDVGWFVYLPDPRAVQMDEIPSDLRLCLEFADKAHCPMICFDRDVPAITDTNLFMSET